MRLYHFLCNEYAKEALINKRLKASIINELNDPFEFQAGFLNPHLEIRETFVKFKNSVSRRYGILCFSKNWHNPLLWSHYAKKHTGCALGFDIPEEKATEVKYSKYRPLFTWDKIPQDPRITEDYFDKLIKTKFLSWEYEEEFRLFYHLDTLDRDNGLYFQRFDDNLILKEVITGCKYDMRDEELLGLLKEYNGTTVIKARMAFKSFKIVQDRIRVWNKP